jgi:peptidoglycan hydrolase-like protein with peptidoglycan-binding domain
LSDSIAARRRVPLAVAAVLAVAATAAPAQAASKQLGSRILSVGMRGADVRTLQRDLTISGYATRANGVFNHTTRSHVVAFQRRFHLHADGVVGPSTVSKLVSVVRVQEKAAPGASDGAVGLIGAPPAARSTKQTGSSSTTGTGSGGDGTGGISIAPGPVDAPVEKARLDSDGLAVPPADAPAVIRDAIAAANQIAFLPYIYGGGHASFIADGYDCSGSVSFALHGGGLLSSPLDSSEFETWGSRGRGRWITLWTNAGHVYMNIAGLWFDTAAQDSANGNDRWSATRVSAPKGFMVRHPTGW